MDTKFTGSSNYVASQDLMETVNIAVALQKPLLIKGEPGTGKTMLAQAVADALGKQLIIWSSSVNPTSPAKSDANIARVKISIHTPRVGRDLLCHRLITAALYFNPHAPCGA